MENLHAHIQDLIERTNNAFVEYHGGVNTDYAEFACMALADFKRALSDPDLTEYQLISALRKAMDQNKAVDPKSWSILMAQCVANSVLGDQDLFEGA